MRVVRTVTILALLAGAGCSAGTHFKWKQARELKIGMTTQEVEKVMGRPYSVTSLSTPDGPRERWVWVYVNLMTGNKSLSVTFAEKKVIELPQIPDSFED